MSSDYDDGSLAFRLRQEVAEQFSEDFEDEQPNREDVLRGEFKSPPALEGVGGKFGTNELVGHGKQTSEKCGSFRRFVGCTRREFHNKVVFDEKSGSLVDFSGKGWFKPVFHSCDKPSCPICYERGWAVREAGNIEFRLKEASKHFGLVEHIIVAVPSKLYGLSFEELYKKMYRALSVRGVVGGVVIPHGFRFGVHRVWHWSPHFHVLGFIYGGYGDCRGCFKHTGKPCRHGCGGFVDRNFRLQEQDSFYLKVKGKRKSVWGTAWYQLHHASIDASKKRAHVATWFGVCSYKKLKIGKELRTEYDAMHRIKCPICGSDLARHEYCGRNLDIIAFFKKRRGARESMKGFYDKASDWVEVGERGSGSYEA